jgi:signal transduction histidine kinase
MPTIGSTFSSWLSDAYIVFNVTAFVAYFLIFLMSVHQLMRLQHGDRNSAILFILCLLPFFAMLFFVNVISGLTWSGVHLTVFQIIIALGPLVLIFVFRKRIFDFTFESRRAVTKFDKLKDEFLSVASHELRTPLSIINGFAEILVREKLGTLNEEQKRRVRKILMQAQRLNHIIDNLLDLSRIRSGKVEIKRAVFDLVPVMKAAIDDQQVVCDQQRITMVDQISDVIPDVIGDLDRTTQIVINLLNNAIKYTHAGGKITVRASYDSSRNQVVVEVEDTGIGISLEDQPLVFKEFFRATEQHARKYAGSGLGLAIVKQLVECQGGSVGLKSEGVGRGALFYFTLPIAGTPAATSPADKTK